MSGELTLNLGQIINQNISTSTHEHIKINYRNDPL